MKQPTSVPAIDGLSIRNGRRSGRRAGQVVLGILVLFGIAAAWRWHSVFDPVAVKAAIDRYPAAPVVFLAIHVCASLFFLPRTLLAVVAGMLFGIGWGIVWAALGSVLGAVCGFLACRYLDPGLIDHAGMARFAPALARVEAGGWRMVALIRLIPIVPHSLANYALGLTRIRLAPFVLGSLVGQLPLTIAYVDLGAAGERVVQGGMAWIVPTSIGIAALLISMAVPALARRRVR